MKKAFDTLALIAATACLAPAAQAHVHNYNLNGAPDPRPNAFNQNKVADPCTNATALCQSANTFTHYGWMGGTTDLLEDSHYVTTDAEEFDFHLDRASTVTIVVTADGVEGATLNPAFSVYKGILAPAAHDDDTHDLNNPYGNTPLVSAKDAAPGDPNIPQFILNPDFTGSPNPQWTDAVAQQYAQLYTPHNGYRDTLNHTLQGPFSSFDDWANVSFHGQFDAFGDWSISNGDGAWNKIRYIASVSNTPCAGPNCGTTTTGGFANPGHTQGNNGLSETLTLKLAAGDYAIWAGGESGLCTEGRGQGTCTPVNGGAETGIAGSHAYATVRLTAIAALPPTAKAGADIAVDENTQVILDGSGSAPANPGESISFHWSQTAGPAVVLSDNDSATASKPSFAAPSVATDTPLSFDLVVKDAQGLASSADSVAVTVRDNANGRPNANAGADQSTDADATVTLDGSLSSDPTPGQTANLIYHWKQIGTPAITLNANDNAAAKRTAFKAPSVATNTVLSFALTVTDPDGNDSINSAVTNVTVKQKNNPPNADAGDAQTVRAGTLVTLDGGNSHDPESDSLGYTWTAPPGIALSDAHAQKPTFTAPLEMADKTLDFSLKVNDGKLDSAASPVAVKVTADNNPPTVKIIDQAVKEGATVTLNATVSDPDGDGIASYLWQQTGGTPVVLSQVDGPSLSFAAPLVGDSSAPLSFSLTATDDFAPNPLSGIDTTTVTVDNDTGLLDCTAATAQPASLFPANKAMKSIRIQGVTPANGYRLTITGITADESVKAKAVPLLQRLLGLAPSTGPAAVIVKGKGANGQDSALLRADRRRKGRSANGRVYVVNFTATANGQSCAGAVKVEVPVARGQAATDDGQNFTATRKK